MSNIFGRPTTGGNGGLENPLTEDIIGNNKNILGITKVSLVDLESKTGTIINVLDTMDLGGNIIQNVANPVNPQDAVTKSFLESGQVIGSGTSVDGGIVLFDGITGNVLKQSNMTEVGADLITNGLSIITVGGLINNTTINDGLIESEGVAPLQLSSKSGNIEMLDELNMGDNKIINLGNPTIDTDGANKLYVDTQITALPTPVLGTTIAIPDEMISYASADGIVLSVLLSE